MKEITVGSQTATPQLHAMTTAKLTAAALVGPDGDLDDGMESQNPDGAIIPFLRWPGGKRWFVSFHQRLIPKTFERYFEPFLGGGSMYFYLRPTEAILSDVNVDVIRAFQGVRDYPTEVKALLEEYQVRHDKTLYLTTRAAEPENLAEQAARIIYLNRTCFNGIYRLNRAGQFNVPMGERTQIVFPTDDFQRASSLLKTATLSIGDFEAVVEMAGKGDFVFADPPYTVRHNTNGFVRYNETLFSWADQIRLAEALISAWKRGAQILSTNAAHESVRKLYEREGFQLRTVSRFSPIAAQADNRKQFDELVVTA